MKTVLHVGCGPRATGILHQSFRGWQEIRLDVDPQVEPDIVADMKDMKCVPDESVDGVWSSHCLEHMGSYDVPLVLAEFKRVLRPGGHVLITVPDIQQVAEAIAAGGLEKKLYDSPAGPIMPLDVVYGHQASIKDGQAAMAHRTGFTAETLKQKLIHAGFAGVRTESSGMYSVWATGKKEPV